MIHQIIGWVMLIGALGVVVYVLGWGGGDHRKTNGKNNYDFKFLDGGDGDPGSHHP